MTIFSRILIACILPLIIIFSAVMLSINNIVREQTITFAENLSRTFAREISKQINDGFTNVQALVEVVAKYAGEVDGSSPAAEETISEWIKSILMATPYVYNIWVSYEPDAFFKEERFSRDFVNLGDSIVVINDLDEDNLDDPDEAPWYYYPYTQGIMWFESADWYDYGLGAGGQYTGTISTPIKHGDKNVGVAGVDMLYKNIFRFINERQIENERIMMVISQEGEIVFASDSALTKTSLLEQPFADTAHIAAMLETDAPFSVSDVSPFSGLPSRIFFHPLSNIGNRNKQLFLYVDIPESILFGEADRCAQFVAVISILGLLLFIVILFFTVRGILKPIKKLTRSASMVTANNLDINLSSIINEELKEDAPTKNEFHTLFSALKNMSESIAMAEKYKALSQAKSDFLAKVSHEIRTPMNAITGMAELALRENIPQSAKEHVLTIKQAGSNLLAIINDILDFSKIESGKLEIVTADYQFASLVNDVISIIRMRVINTPVRFIVNVDRRIPSVLHGDDVRIRQILLNLLSNAVKYTKEGFISLTIRGEAICNDTVTLAIDVTDTGRGIKKEDIGKLFGRFVQIDVEANSGIEGTGLGLAITKNLATAMGGGVGVESEYGKGSTFTVTLPQKIRSLEPLASVEEPHKKSVLVYETCELYAKSVMRTVENLGVRCVCVKNDVELFEKLSCGDYTYIFAESDFCETIKKMQAETQSKSRLVILADIGGSVAEKNLIIITAPAYSIPVANVLNGFSNSSLNADEITDVTFHAPDARVLIVDDIKTNLEVAKGLLAPYGMTIDTCLNGMDAIRAITDNNYDLVLMDHMMPDMDGIEAVKQIRACGKTYTEIPIIALTANAVSGMREMFLQNGFNDFLSKPIDITRLGLILERWIPKAKQKNADKKFNAITDKDAALIDDMVIDGLDVRLGMSRSGGTASAYLKTLEIFREDGREKITEIGNCLNDGNLPLYTTYVHALKSASANIGAQELSEDAKVLEAAAKRGDKAFLSENTGRVISKLVTLLQRIDVVISHKKNMATIRQTGIDTNELDAILADLKTAIDKIDPSAINAGVKRLESFENTCNENINTAIKAITQHVLNGEYDEAAEIIDALPLYP